MALLIRHSRKNRKLSRLGSSGPIIHSLLHVGLLQNFACQVYWYVAFFLPVFSTFNVNSLCVHAVNGWRHQPGTTKTFIRFLQCFSPRLTSSLHAYCFVFFCYGLCFSWFTSRTLVCTVLFPWVLNFYTPNFLLCIIFSFSFVICILSLTNLLFFRFPYIWLITFVVL